MNIDDILNPATAIGAILVAVISGLILYFITKNSDGKKKNMIKVKENNGFIFQDSKLEGDINVKEQDKSKK